MHGELGIEGRGLFSLKDSRLIELGKVTTVGRGDSGLDAVLDNGIGDDVCDDTLAGFCINSYKISCFQSRKTTSSITDCRLCI